jgi:hypothetical protein
MISTPENPHGGECVIDANKIGDLGSTKQVTSRGVIYYNPGVTVREFNHQELRLPQKRTFLGPEFYHSGCTTRYGSTRVDNFPNSAENISENTLKMFDQAFESHDHAITQDFCTSCAGPKYGTPNAYTSY